MLPYGNDEMEENEITLTQYYKNEEVKIVWKEEGRTKLGRGKIIKDDDVFIYLKGSKGLLVVNRTEVIAIKGSKQQ